MSRDTAISMVVAHVDSRERLEWLIEGIEAKHRISLDREHILAIWRDIRNVPKSRAL